MIKTASSDGYTFLSSLNEQRSENIRSTEHDLELIGMIRDRLLNVAPELNNGRILAQISVSCTGGKKLRGTLRRLFNQADENGVALDLMIGMNNGAQMTPMLRGLEECRADIIELFTAYTGRDRLGNEQVFGNPHLSGVPYLVPDARSIDHRVIIVNQQEAPEVKGKNAMLKVLNDLTIASISAGEWEHPPSLTLELDDESRFFNSDITSEDGLGFLLEEMDERQLSAIGARWNNVPFQETILPTGAREMDPDFEKEILAAYRFLDYSQANKFKFMPGGGTLGKTDMLAAARWPIGHRYIGSTSDDVHRTMYVDRMKESWGISNSVYVTNECRNSRDQMVRWLTGTFALRKALGIRNFRGMNVGDLTLDPSFPYSDYIEAEPIIREAMQGVLDMDTATDW